MRFRAGAALAATISLGCALGPATSARPLPAGPQIRVSAQPVPLDRDTPARQSVGRFRYAGGLWLTSPDTGRLHGLSDLKVWPDERFLSVSDEGDLVEGRLALDRAGRLSGVAEVRLWPLTGADGRPLAALGKNESDSEGVAELANGDRLVSLERHDRILLYPSGGGPPRRAPAPDVRFPFNLGVEGLAEDPAAGPDAYVVGAEASGQTWTCSLSAGCAPSALVAKDADEGLSAVAVLPATILPGGGRAYLLRSFSLLRGVRVRLRIVDGRGATLDELQLAGHLTVDNFEGLAALPGPGGVIRFYLISDDNFSHLQRTLLLAFDWTPPRGRTP